MPILHTYGVGVSIQLVGALANLPETLPIIDWRPTEGMTHPICTTTVVSPMAAESRMPIPFGITVTALSDWGSLPQRLKGDMRIEIKIDGVVRHIKVMRAARIWPTGTSMTFTGTRVGRTEEKAFAFMPLPRDGQSPTAAVHHKRHPVPFPSVEDQTLVPRAPAALPSNSSFVQVLITLGTKHNTVEKYLLYTPLFLKAFYHPPPVIRGSVPPPSQTPTPDLLSPFNPRKRKLPPSPGRGAQEGEAADARRTLGSLTRSSKPVRPVQAPLLIADSAAIEYAQQPIPGWRPIGLASTSQKTVQMKETEFSGRIHLARFWFIVEAPPGFTKMTEHGASTGIKVTGSTGKTLRANGTDMSLGKNKNGAVYPSGIVEKSEGDRIVLDRTAKGLYQIGAYGLANHIERSAVPGSDAITGNPHTPYTANSSANEDTETADSGVGRYPRVNTRASHSNRISEAEDTKGADASQIPRGELTLGIPITTSIKRRAGSAVASETASGEGSSGHRGYPYRQTRGAVLEVNSGLGQQIF